MLQQSNTNPNVCAWTVLKGAHDFNRHPLAPLGIEMHMLTPAGNRRSWGVKSEKCFYIKTSLEHYRYFKGWHPKTRAVQGSETVLFKHKYITAPTVTPSDAIIQAAKELEDTLKSKIPPPLAKSGIDTLKQCTIFWHRVHVQRRGGECKTSEGGHQRRRHTCEGGKNKQPGRPGMAKDR